MQVPKQPIKIDVSQFVVGNPVMGLSTRQLIDQTGYLLGTNTEHVVSTLFPAPLTASAILPSTMSLGFYYQRSPGAQYLAIDYLLFQTLRKDDTYSISTCYMSATLPAGVTFVDNPSAFDGSQSTTVRTKPYSPTSVRTPTMGREYFDVSSLSTASVNYITLGITNSVNAGTAYAGYGIKRLNVNEVPIIASHPESSPLTEIGLDPGWSLPDMRLFDGTAQAKLGFVRLEDQLDKARNEVRKHWQWIGYRDSIRDATAMSTAISTDVNIDFKTDFAATNRKGYLRLSNLYGSGSTSPYLVLCAYYNSSSKPWQLDMFHRPSGSTGAYTTSSMALAVSTAPISFASMSVSLTNDTTKNSEVEFSFGAQTVQAGLTCSFYNLCLIESNQ